MIPQLQNVPIELRERPQWVTWKYVDGDKVPFNARTGKAASSVDPTTWATFDEACTAAQHRHHAGVGYVFSPDDPFTGIDLDDCIDDAGAIADWAGVIIATMASYSEVSPSGTGVKIWVVGDVPKSVKTKGIEIYPSRRYFTVTGNRLEGTPEAIRNVNGELTQLYTSLKPAPRPQLTPAPPPQVTTDSDHARRYALGALRDEAAIMQAAGDGERHNQRLKSAHALAGYIPHITEDEITAGLAVNFGASEASARKTIADGIVSGKAAPRTIPAPKGTDTQFDGRSSSSADDLDSVDPAVLRSRLRDTLAERDHWRDVAQHADGWRDWALKVAALPTETLSPAAKVVAISLWPEMKSRESRGVDEPKRIYIQEFKDKAGLSAGTFGGKLKELQNVGAIERETQVDAVTGYSRVLIKDLAYSTPAAWMPPEPRNHGGLREKKERPAPVCSSPGCDEETPVMEEMTVIKQPLCATCETPLGDPDFKQRRYMLWDPAEQLENLVQDTELLSDAETPDTQLDHQLSTVVPTATQVDGRPHQPTFDPDTQFDGRPPMYQPGEVWRALWRGPDTDEEVTIIGVWDAALAPDGRQYYQVEESTTGIPADDVELLQQMRAVDPLADSPIYAPGYVPSLIERLRARSAPRGVS